MKQHTWSQTYNVSAFLVNPQKRLGLYGLLNLIQDIAWNHAIHLGHGYEDMLKDKMGWVLTRQILKMNEWPKWGDDVEIRTWIRPITSLLAIRDFEIIDKGKIIGECSTQWLTFDLEKRRPAERPLHLTSSEVRADAPNISDASKIILKNDLHEIAQFHVRNSDLDLNGHVNNTRYAQWILDAISEEKHKEYSLLEYEVNFIAETKMGDVISIQSGALSEDRFQFQGVRMNDNKVVFAATIKVSARHLPPPYNQF